VGESKYQYERRCEHLRMNFKADHPEAFPPDEPQLPIKPLRIEKDDSPGWGCGLMFLFGILGIILLANSKSVSGGDVVWIIFAIIFGGVGFFAFILKPGVEDLTSYNQRLAKYEAELKDFERKKQQHSKDVEEYHKRFQETEILKKHILSENNVREYRTTEFYTLLKKTKCPSLLAPGENALKGVSETFFKSSLIQTFGNRIKDNMILNFHNNSYYPDLVYWDQETNLIIDIEIDEPYVGYSGKPIHYRDKHNRRIDDTRDMYFLREGWIVIRFAEEQIFKSTSECISVIQLIIEKVLNKQIFTVLPEEINCKTNIWTQEEAQTMGYKRYRHSYVPKKYHSLLQVEGEYI
jgi:hypothetical protein